MKLTTSIMLIACIVVLLAALPASAASYAASGNLAVQWLTQNQYGDGSWGATYDVTFPCTVEAVMALRSLNQQTPAYYKGITWLENHGAPNVDYEARRILALGPNGDNVSVDLSYIQTTQTLTAPGNNGWGLTPDYQGSPLDSAMALLAYSQTGVTSNVTQGISYITGAQLTGTDMGWSVAQETTSDPFTTSLVIQALVNYKSSYSLSTPIANGISTLLSKVGSGSPTHLKALAALACIRAGYGSNATTLLNSLTATQSSDGSWSEDVYATALAARAMAAATGTDLASLSTVVYIPDPNLRAAINKALGKNAMDELTEGDMANLVSISAENMGITDLTGMQWAVNLTFADFQNNNIASITPLSGLTKLATLEWTGNPGYTPPPQTAAVPAMSMPVLLLTAVLLMLAGAFRRRGGCHHEL